MKLFYLGLSIIFTTVKHYAKLNIVNEEMERITKPGLFISIVETIRFGLR
ncbi:hypothetical protein KR50_35290 [Jeotgalibacillus campisalis]|uniref:Uncharacterized protein n=1 Tax=Jeotgalibacillus campisalis TaxID=220754 RepID=A0A0C2VF28_9BACL|nr:hypothetical protein KR50_35290 [Jeotgalibacillus campisalis]